VFIYTNVFIETTGNHETNILCDISLIPHVFKWENGGKVKEVLQVESLPLLFLIVFELILFLCPDPQL
jgi:uncharacterized membrane protein